MVVQSHFGRVFVHENENSENVEALRKSFRWQTSFSYDEAAGRWYVGVNCQFALITTGGEAPQYEASFGHEYDGTITVTLKAV